MQFSLLTLITQLRKDGVLLAVHTSGASPQSSASHLLTFLLAQLQFLREWKLSDRRLYEVFERRLLIWGNPKERNRRQINLVSVGPKGHRRNARLRHLSDIIFRNWVINVSNQNCIYYRLFWCWHNLFILLINKVTIIWKTCVLFAPPCISCSLTAERYNIIVCDNFKNYIQLIYHGKIASVCTRHLQG